MLDQLYPLLYLISNIHLGHNLETQASTRQSYNPGPLELTGSEDGQCTVSVQPLHGCLAQLALVAG